MDLAADYLDLLRVCVIATNLGTVKPFVEPAQSKGLEASIQLVDSHLFEPDVLACAPKQASEMGVRIVYVVDTTGTFLPEDVRRYAGAIRDASNVTIGFRGHNKLGMAVANALEAFEAGADFLDGTLTGFGCGARTCKTESLIAALQQRGHLVGIDLDWIIGAARANMLGRAAETNGIGPWEFSYGFHGLDSRQLEHIRGSAKSIEEQRLSLQGIDRVAVGMQP